MNFRRAGGHDGRNWRHVVGLIFEQILDLAAQLEKPATLTRSGAALGNPAHIASSSSLVMSPVRARVRVG